jgi:hypothetical protein
MALIGGTGLVGAFFAIPPSGRRREVDGWTDLTALVGPLGAGIVCAPLLRRLIFR